MPNYIYGPVPSRRLGRSLGVDLVPFKTCTYDCIYCQLGRTTVKTCERKEWVPVEGILSQVKEALDSNPDYITLAGSGEPSLHSGMTDIISGIKQMASVPIAVLTNGSLLWDEDMAASIMDADLVIPSLDAYNQESFEQVNRPHEDITFDRMVNGLVKFRKIFPGKFWLEVFLLDGITGNSGEVEKMAAIAREINSDRIQLNTVARPPAESYAKAVPMDRMEQFVEVFGDNCEMITHFAGMHEKPDLEARRKQVLDLLMRRPCTLDDIANGLGIHRNEVVKYAEALASEGSVVKKIKDGKTFYEATR